MNAAPSPPSAPVVSIGIPTYSRPNELRATLEQIVGQSHSNLEIIVSDNATEGDSVRQVVQSFAAIDHRIRYFRQQRNLGPESNFQFVLDKATGDYFMWCADDDWHHPDFVARLLQEMRRRPEASIAFCDIKAIDPAGNELPIYDGYYARLLKLTGPGRTLRQWRFYLQPEWRGKPCVMYGLLKRDRLRGFSWPAFYAKHGFSFADNLFAFTLLAHGPVVAVPDKLFGFQVGNPKHYADQVGPSFAPARKLGVWLRYVSQYVRLARGPAKLLYALGMPLKIAQITGVFMIRRLRWPFQVSREHGLFTAVMHARRHRAVEATMQHRSRSRPRSGAETRKQATGPLSQVASSLAARHQGCRGRNQPRAGQQACQEPSLLGWRGDQPHDKGCRRACHRRRADILQIPSSEFASENSPVHQRQDKQDVPKVDRDPNRGSSDRTEVRG